MSSPRGDLLRPSISSSFKKSLSNNSGQPLDGGTRAFMESRLGHDFSRVRVHTDSRAAESAQAINALAYTVGHDIAFGPGQYMPRTPKGRALLAHELTHVIQQQGISNGTIQPAINRAEFMYGSRRELELEAQTAAHAISAGKDYRPQYRSTLLAPLTAPATSEQEVKAKAEASSLAVLGSGAERTANVKISVGQQQETGKVQSLSYSTMVSGSGARGSINTQSVVSVVYHPEIVSGGGVIEGERGEQPAKPSAPTPVYPFTITYQRNLRLTDRDRREATVTVSSVVHLSQETWMQQLAGKTLSMQTLLDMQGDTGSISVIIDGKGPLQPYYANYYHSGVSVGIQSMMAESDLMAGAGLLPFTSRVPARFLRAELTAGEQFESLEAFLVSADAIELARQFEAERQRREALGWLGRLLEDTGVTAALSQLGREISDLWNSLPAPVRGVLEAVGKFVVGVGIIVAAAALIVLAAPEVAFGTAMLVVGAIVLGAAFALSIVSRTIEAIGFSLFNPVQILTTAVLDTVGLGPILEAITDRSLLSGAPLRRTEEERWESGTSGALQLLSIVLGLRGARGGKPAGPELGGPRGGRLGEITGLKQGGAEPGVRPMRPPGPELGGPRVRGRLGEIAGFEELGGRRPVKMTDVLTQAQRQNIYGRLERGELSLRDFVRMFGEDGVEQVYFRTPRGGRYVDFVFESGDRVVLYESKNVSDFALTDRINAELEADIFLLRKHPEAHVHWRIRGTGRISPEAFDTLEAIKEMTGGRFTFQLQDSGPASFSSGSETPATIH